MKRVLSFVLIFAMIASLVVIPAVAAPENMPADDYRIISTAEELKAISGKAGNYVLAADIDFGGETLTTPITLSGVLDGAGHTVKNFKLAFADGKTETSLFAQDGNVTVRNLSVGSADEKLTLTVTGISADSCNVSVLFASNMNKKDNADVVLNVLNVHIWADATVSKARYGAFLAEGKGSQINFRSCTSNGSVVASETSGSAGISGFIGRMSNDSQVTFDRCINNSALVGGESVGGFVGYANCSGWLHINDCINNGTITCTFKSGGFLGYIEQMKYSITVNRVWNAADITSTASDGGSQVGAFAGRIAATPLTLIRGIFVSGELAVKINGGLVGNLDNNVVRATNWMSALTGTVLYLGVKSSTQTEDNSTNFCFGTAANYSGIPESQRLDSLAALVDKLNANAYMADFHAIFGSVQLNAEGG